MQSVHIAGRIRHSSVNGPGVRYVLFFQGCPHDCPGCQNPETHDPQAGTETDVEDLIREIRSTRFLDGITLSGGDPLMQPEAAKAIALAGKDAGLSVWLYTGWTWEQLIRQPSLLPVLQSLDVLVDGPFIEKEKHEGILWRGSANQRLIDVKASLAEPMHTPILINEMQF